MYDVAIIGGGPGGTAAAIHASEKGLKTLLIEKSKIGGVCLHSGCIPTKSLLHMSQLYYEINRAKSFGLTCTQIDLDFPKMNKRKTQQILKLSKGLSNTIASKGIDYISGKARFLSDHTISVLLEDNSSLLFEAKNIIIATGSSPRKPNFSMNISKHILTTDDLNELSYLPKSIGILGAGVVGVEYATFFSQLGIPVILMDSMDRILSSEDVTSSDFLTRSLQRVGVSLYLNTTITEIQETETSLTLLDSNLSSHKVEKLLVAIGRSPNINTLTLDRLSNPILRKEQILVNHNFQTDLPHIYAIGDVNGISLLAHSASFQGKHVIDMIVGGNLSQIPPLIPSCVYSYPEVASIGSTTSDLEDNHIPFDSIMVSLNGNGRLVTLNQSEGFIKCLLHKETHRILGFHIVSPHASELISIGSLVMQSNLPATEWSKILFPHPTLSEAYGELFEHINKLLVESRT